MFNIKRLFIVSLTGLVLLSRPAWPLTDKVYKELSTFTQVMDIIDKYYVTNVDEKEILRGAIQGMLSTLDPHTVYFPAEVYKAFNSDTKGLFGGVGIEVSVKDGVLTVVAPLMGSPAWDAGIKSGDRILSIDGKSTKYMSLGEAVLLMRGSIGKKISLSIWRQGKVHMVALTRSLIKVPGVKTEDLGEGYGLFRITSFQEGVAKQLKREIDDFQKAHGELKGIILDVRDNPGGLLGEAVKICDFFLKDGVIVSTKGRTSETEVKRAHEAGTMANFPIIVLINNGSASAAEILAGALKDQNRAKLMGLKSFGKGSVQTVINLDNGDAVKITIAHYFTPSNKMIDGKGIDPDVLLDKKLFKKKRGGNASSKNQTLTRDEFDEFQKQEALVYLKKMR